MPTIETTLQHFPVIFTKFDGEQTIEDVDRYWNELEEVYGRQELFVTVNWMKHHSRERKLIKHMGECVKRYDARSRAYCASTAMVTASLAFRFTLSSMFLIHPLPIPYIVSPTVEGALEFCRAEAAKRGLRVPIAARSPWPDAP